MRCQHSWIILVMTSPPVSLPKTDIKPVYLMLSSCHRDIAAKGGSVDVAFHVRQATECLQQVYGTDVPRAQVTSEFAEARARTCMSLPHLLASAPTPDLETGPIRERLADTVNLPAARSHREQSPSNRVPEAPASTDSLQRIHPEWSNATTTHSERSPPRSRTRTDSHSRNTSYSERDRHVQMLEREIQSLRDRTAEQNTTLLSIRKEKRRLEDELVAKHTTCRRLERDAEATSGELARAQDELARARKDAVQLKDELNRVRRGEESALEQAAAEVAGRRAAEGRVDVLREEMGRLRNEVDRLRADGREDEREAERRARETFARLGAMFVKAGRGELPIGLGLPVDGEGGGTGGDVRRTPVALASDRVGREDARSRSASTSGKGWGSVSASVSVSGMDGERERRSSGNFERPL